MKSGPDDPSAVREAPLAPPAYGSQPIRSWAAHERPRERLYSHGPAALSDAELLAVLLGSGSAGRDAVSTGRALLARAGSLGRLLAEAKELPPISGFGPVKRARLIVTLELARRALGEGLVDLPRIDSPRDSAQYLRARMVHLRHEVFACLFLDTRHRVLAYEELFRGTIDGASVYPREVVRACLRHHASAVILRFYVGLARAFHLFI
ncbi:JAB domain-containing protein [Luteibacter sp. NPDC031894]|uniref:JAB domain-containing protein n=1 Tax=Luteibacter sp. NPDC031894 TaxID=3390572 RepID=UPI003D073784